MKPGMPAVPVGEGGPKAEAVLDLMRRFSGATRFAYNRLLEGKPREELKRADGATEKAKAVLDSALELGNDPKKVVFGGRGLFEQLKRKHLSGKPLEALKRRWKEKRQGFLFGAPTPNEPLQPGRQEQGGQPQSPP